MKGSQMPNASKTLCFTMLLTLPYLSACAQESKKENIILGEWARSKAECTRPELKFTETQLDIHIDADGAPVAFEYKNIGYVQSPLRILVQLHARHPYSKTLDKNTLLFEIKNNNSISMQHLKIKNTEFVRCPTK
jgi:hypothetical protein